ncbi:MAG: helix-turn-helix domain-containing protein [Atribacterota bacterium]|nr:helix-turn-helix domain-containing protein [Atribacterota bacterium]
MTKDDFLVSYKYSVLQHARKHNNITDTCQVLNVSRTIYYKWLKRLKSVRLSGLQDKKKTKPKMLKPDKEQIILNYIIVYPTHGQRRITNELKQQGMTISDTGVYNVLCRKQLNHRLDRLFYT